MLAGIAVGSVEDEGVEEEVIVEVSRVNISV